MIVENTCNTDILALILTKNAITGDQTTLFQYGTALADSDVADGIGRSSKSSKPWILLTQSDVRR